MKETAKTKERLKSIRKETLKADSRRRQQKETAATADSNNSRQQKETAATADSSKRHQRR